MLEILCTVFVHAVAHVSEFDVRLVWCQIEEPLLKGPHRFNNRITLASEPPQKTHVLIDGSARVAYRCGGKVEEKFQWFVWSGEVFGNVGCQKGFPVYIQKHALNRLHERLRPIGHSSIHLSLLWSLNKPIITLGRQEDTFLVEFRLADQARVGYLVARRTSDIVVITTFLFLTMQGTPEAEHLSELLRLRRPDIEYNKMDTLRGFINTDLAQDPDLAHILDEAGCRDLMKVTCDDLSIRPVKAAILRQYLGLAPNHVHS
jgi:hypothetical protein